MVGYSSWGTKGILIIDDYMKHCLSQTACTNSGVHVGYLSCLCWHQACRRYQAQWVILWKCIPASPGMYERQALTESRPTVNLLCHSAIKFAYHLAILAHVLGCIS